MAAQPSSRPRRKSAGVTTLCPQSRRRSARTLQPCQGVLKMAVAPRKALQDAALKSWPGPGLSSSRCHSNQPSIPSDNAI